MQPTRLYHLTRWYPDMFSEGTHYDISAFDGWAEVVDWLGRLEDDGRTVQVLLIERNGDVSVRDMTEDAGRCIADCYPADQTEPHPLVHPLARPFDPMGEHSASFRWEAAGYVVSTRLAVMKARVAGAA